MTEDQSIHPATEMGRVALVVADLDRSLDYYQSRIGLKVLDQSAQHATLGVKEGEEGRELLWLQLQPGAKGFPGRGYSGLYHYAILLPSREALGVQLRHLAETRTPLTGASDHGVSEALYMNDPDGHGIEIYRDRQRDEWPRRPDGELAMVTDPLDIEGVLATGEGLSWEGMPAGTVMGHVHLHVSQLPAAQNFYVNQVGFDLIQNYGGQATFVSAGGYHHHLGMNVWAGVGVPPAPEDRARLLWYEIVLPNEDALETTLERLRGAGVPIEAHDSGWLAHDPSQNGMVLRT
jgi:catechol 2,3-dioxygenase